MPLLVNIGNEYKNSIKMQLILNNELDLQVTTPNTVKFVNCCYHYHITYNELKVESKSYPEISLGLKFNLMFFRLT